MIRIRFSNADLGRLRFAVSPLTQIANSTGTPGSVEPMNARRRQHGALARLGSRGRPLRRLSGLGAWNLPDFASPAPTGTLGRFDEELDAMIATSSSRKRDDLEVWQRSPAHRDYAESLVDDRKEMLRLADALREFNRDLFGDKWNGVQHTLQEDVRRRSIQLGQRGVDHALSNLHPRLTWRNPDLYLDVKDGTFPPALALGGRGVILVPSLTWSMTFSIKINDVDPLVIVYPALDRDRNERGAGPPNSARPLAKLMGRSRASVLLVLTERPGLTTSELAAACELSVASASEHATVLRNSGLIASVRDGAAVRHHATFLGVQLCTGQSS